ncbi:MAG: hypothetical protein QOH90_2116 [Actinomycetota bacterium]|jgi:DNA-binding response OmpR family regulator|nr:hypothetical protein [Actinomycetota bacterium]
MILVVSDDPQVREEATFAFPADVEISVVEDAKDAWTSLQQFKPDAIILSLRSGNAGGYSLLAQMSQHPSLKGIPSLLLLERDQDRWLGRQSGATTCLTKPVEAGDLAAATLALI